MAPAEAVREHACVVINHFERVKVELGLTAADAEAVRVADAARAAEVAKAAEASRAMKPADAERRPTTAYVSGNAYRDRKRSAAARRTAQAAANVQRPRERTAR